MPRSSAIRLVVGLLGGGAVVFGGVWAVLHERSNEPIARVPEKRSTVDTSRSSSPSTHHVATADSEIDETAIRTLCGACHLFPPPEILPRVIWPKEIERMYALAGLDATMTEYPPAEMTLSFYQKHAPAELTLAPSYAQLGPGSLRVEAFGVRPGDVPPTPAIAYLKFAHVLGNELPDLLACDMRHGVVLLHQLARPDEPVRVVGRVPFPAHVEVADLDGDGFDDLLVADLGSFLPEDHRKGRVVWLRGRPNHQFEPVTLLDRVGRVADVRAADIDADGDLDLAVAIFGWRSTGQVVLLENIGEADEDGVPYFEPIVLDPRPGAIHVPVVDLDGDGRLDVVAVLSQQFETVMAYLQRDDWDFEPRILFAAPHPDWGSAGIEVVDLDGDGDLDVVAVNGDTLDNSVLKPFHGVYWLENQGTYPFTFHSLATLAGATKVRTADLDGDGDLDVAASSFLPQFPMATSRKPLNLESLIWIEQTAPRRFERHSLETLHCDHPSLEVGDYDGDGDVDLVTGNFAVSPEKLGTIDHWLTVFENQRR